VKAFAVFRDVMPPERDEEEGSAVADLLELLCTGYPGLREPSSPRRSRSGTS
jgi:hypothetical protein